MPATAISADGRTVVGLAHLPNGSTQACVWSSDFGSRFIPSGAFANTAFYSSSFDALVARGTGEANGVERTVIWDPVHGVRDLKQLLLSLGVTGAAPYDLAYSLIAWDGRTIVGHAWTEEESLFIATIPALCSVNCNGSTTTPVLNVNDFICFQEKFAAGDPYANCDRSTAQPVLNVLDFVCFQQHFAAGCP
jgi:hypothetical protein